MIGWNVSLWFKGRLLKGPVLVKIKSCGESAQPLQMEESKYLAMSLTRDNLSIKTWKLSRIYSSQFLSKTCGLTRVKVLQFLLVVPWDSFFPKKNLLLSTN